MSDGKPGALRRWFRRHVRRRCPWCCSKLEKRQMFGLSLSATLCPSAHYLEELHYTGVTLVYSDGGKPIVPLAEALIPTSEPRRLRRVR